MSKTATILMAVRDQLSDTLFNLKNAIEPEVEMLPLLPSDKEDREYAIVYWRANDKATERNKESGCYESIYNPGDGRGFDRLVAGYKRWPLLKDLQNDLHRLNRYIESERT